MIERIAILGTGLLGASTGLALRASGFRGEITGWNRSQDQAGLALQMGAIDAIGSDPLAMARSCQILVLATPVLAILDWMEQLAGVMGPDQVLTDLGSTKAMIVAAANRHFNQADRAAFLPGHPMAGKERSGASMAESILYKDAVWIFTDLPSWQRSSTASQIVAEWRTWVTKMGARIIDLDAERHDELVAWVSHLPQFLSTALCALLEDQVGDAPELKQIGGRGLKEMTRLGASPFSMWRDIAFTNSDAISRALLTIEQKLAHLRENLRTPELRDEFEKANRFRRT